MFFHVTEVQGLWNGGEGFPHCGNLTWERALSRLFCALFFRSVSTGERTGRESLHASGEFFQEKP
ncbi:hypothetical protein HMPREF3038_02383 [Akkermansia sp. KLE1797]|nr:hypothetical protein HMPREF3038_02383 [Akkermansia sp. KLE1797]KXU54884.1 hypothetical protein HMPREF3039_01033 [Akkermansia sp. KLE1798]KZA06267.1 hypothetical protein HMPREF1326_00117 [Akkermansia sp. KLE1605]